APRTPVRSPVESALMPLLRQMAELQGAMFAQFQQSLAMILQILGPTLREQSGDVQTEMDRMMDLNIELQKQHSEMFQFMPSQLPLPEPATPLSAEESANHHQEMWQRMEKLNDERGSLLQRLMGKTSSRS